MKLNVIDIIEGTSVDGPGLRTSIYFAGCKHHCLGCQNPQSWSPDAGRAMTIDELMEVVEYNDFNVTFSGGDPFFQAEGVAVLAEKIRTGLHKNVWCYTGYLWEDILANPLFCPLIHNIDVLVDGNFILGLRDTTLRFRGSSNQRIIDVQKSLGCNSLVLYG